VNKNRSIATIDEPQFINLEENALNPGISQCEIKVFYLGENRNHSYIDKNTAIQMANSLPGTPIVGAYRKDIEDFGDHGHVMHIEDGEITFSCKTIPYGFVAPDADVWFQKFEDFDEFGNEIEREYLMTTGYLWTGQYPEVKACVTEGKGQSMELDEESLDGHWATNGNTGIEFFIINDAIFTKLCILGDDVEPCFEGASVTSPEVSKNFSKDPEFSRTLFSMMNQLKFALQNKGGSDMPNGEQIEEVENTENEEETTEEVEETENEVEETSEDSAEGDDSEDSEDTDFACGGGSKKKKKYAEEDKEEEDSSKEDPKQEDKPAEDDQKKKKAGTQNSLTSEKMQAEFEAMKQELEELREFKLEQENLKKDDLINKYFMLSDEDKADVIAHKSEYSYEEIEEKLALAYVRKNVDFTTIDGQTEEEEESPIATFSLDSQSAGFVPPVVEALRHVKESNF
jgi:hypothetical protein